VRLPDLALRPLANASPLLAIGLAVPMDRASPGDLGQRHGFASRIGAEQRELLCAWRREQPDLTDEELRHRLAASGVAVSKSRVGQLLFQMGARRKKSRSTPLSATRKPTKSGAASSSPRSAR